MIFVASKNGLVAGRNAAAYSSAKAAVNSLPALAARRRKMVDAIGERAAEK